MLINVITLFPEMFRSFLAESMMGKALAKGVLTIDLISPREFAGDRHQTADDRPYGGGPGMVLKPEPLGRAIEAALAKGRDGRVVFLTPSGQPLKQPMIREWAELPQLVLVCGRYEGFDQRALDLWADEEVSLGDYVLNGGEVPAMAVIEAVARLRPGFMGRLESALEESHASGLLEYPHYTRPPVFQGLAVPEVLLSGHHGQVAAYRLEKALARTLARRPELLVKAELAPQARLALARAGLENRPDDQ